MTIHRYVPPDEFTPESRSFWQPVGRLTSWTRDLDQGAERVKFTAETGHRLFVTLLSPTAFRVRFDPDPAHVFEERRSPVVRQLDVEECDCLRVEEIDARVVIDTGKIVIEIKLDHYHLAVFRNGQLIHADADDYNLVYIPGQQVIANFKKAPGPSRYFGFGEKAGTTLDKRRVPEWHFTQARLPLGDVGWFSGPNTPRRPSRLTFFNFDNFGYSRQDENVIAARGENAGPLNPNVPLYQSSPFWIESNPRPDGAFHGPPYFIGVLFDNTCQTFVNLSQGDQYYFGGLYGEMDYYVFTGPTPTEILDELTVATGRSPLWPRWVFGYHQGGYGPNYNTADRLRAVAQAYRDARIPIDGLHIDIDIQNNYRNFSTSPSRFPDPAGLFGDLHARGFKLSTNVTPLVSMMAEESGANSPYIPLDSGRLTNAFVSNRRDDGGGTDESFIGNVNYGGSRFAYGHYADLGKTEIQQWWGDLYRFWLDLGLDMVWQDMATPCMESSVHESPNRFRSIPLNCQLWDNEESRFSATPMPSRKLSFAKTRNLFSYNLVKSTDDGLRRLAPGRRHFIIARGGFIGEHRHAGVWTGDNMSGWEWLILNIPQSINMGLSAQPIAGSDIGGFGGFGGNCDAEMLVRWTSLGAMLPWFRNHYGHYDNKTFQEPYRYGDPTASVCRKVIELRYRWLQVFYDTMHENHRRGTPIVRPLFWHSDDPGVYEHHDWWYWPPNGRGFHYNFSRLDDQFFLGKDILVAPVILPEWITGAPERPVYLPSGARWFAFKDNRYPLDLPIDGGVQFSFRAPWNNAGDPYPNNIPIYIREGAIIPHRELEQFVGERKRAGRLNPLTLNIYPGESGTYRLFVDDEETDRADTNGEYREVEVSHQRSPNGRTVRIHRVHDGYAPPENFYFTACLEPVEPKGVTLRSADGSLNRTLNRLSDADALMASSEPAFYFNGSLRATFVKVFDSQSDVTLQFAH